MIQKISEQIVLWQIKKKILIAEDYEMYQYAYEVLIAQVVNIIIALIIAIIFHSVITVSVFLISYIPLRSYAGGYHANTNEKCIRISACIICFVSIFYKVFPMEYYYCFFIMSVMVSGTIIWILSPVENKNKPLEDIEILKYRKYTRIIWCIEFSISLVCIVIGLKEIAFVTALSNDMLGIILYLGYQKQQK